MTYICLTKKFLKHKMSIKHCKKFTANICKGTKQMHIENMPNDLLETNKTISWLNTICDTFDYPTQAKVDLVNCYEKIKENEQSFLQFSYTVNEYAKDYKTDFTKMSEQIKKVADQSGANEYTSYTLFLICILQPLKELYAKHNYSKIMWEEIVLDVKYKLLECHDLYGVYGTFVMPWFDRFFDLTRFCFGRLQMETIELDGDYIVNGVSLKKGDTVLSVHIPRSGQSLDRQLVEDSYRKAKDFYKDYFPNGYTVFTCKTYLMHSSTLSLLNENSNIYKFVNDYDIVYNKEYPNYSELWRLYDCVVENKDVDSLPNNTSLRKKFIEYMKSGKKFGYGHGIYVYR